VIVIDKKGRNKMKLGNFIRVENMLGRANQFVIYTDQGTVFSSYGKNICAKFDGRIYLDEKYYNFSQTTSQYRNLFLGKITADVEKKVKSGHYVLVDMN